MQASACVSVRVRGCVVGKERICFRVCVCVTMQHVLVFECVCVSVCVDVWVDVCVRGGVYVCGCNL